MYYAKLTEQGVERHGLYRSLIGAEIEYDTIVPPNKCIDGYWLNGERFDGITSFVGDDRSVELITWPDDFDYQGG